MRRRRRKEIFHRIFVFRRNEKIAVGVEKIEKRVVLEAKDNDRCKASTVECVVNSHDGFGFQSKCFGQ